MVFAEIGSMAGGGFVPRDRALYIRAAFIGQEPASGTSEPPLGPICMYSAGRAAHTSSHPEALDKCGPGLGRGYRLPIGWWHLATSGQARALAVPVGWLGGAIVPARAEKNLSNACVVRHPVCSTPK